MKSGKQWNSYAADLSVILLALFFYLLSLFNTYLTLGGLLLAYEMGPILNKTLNWYLWLAFFKISVMKGLVKAKSVSYQMVDDAYTVTLHKYGQDR